MLALPPTIHHQSPHLLRNPRCLVHDGAPVQVLMMAVQNQLILQMK